MKNKKILKEYSIKSTQQEDPKLELEKRLSEKVNEASRIIDALVGEFVNECNEIINELKKKETVLELKYREKLEKVDEFHVKRQNEFNKKTELYITEKNKELEDYKSTIHNELSNSLGLIVEKVLKQEYKKTSTIENIIDYYIGELPEAKSILISLNEESYELFANKTNNKYLELQKSGVEFDVQRNTEILLDIKTDIGGVVVNKKKQIQEVLELIGEFK